MLKISIRKAATRRHVTSLPWLNAYQSFGVTPEYPGFGLIQVLNEDYISPKKGFNMHPHNDFEIFTYMLAGELTHRDTITKNEKDKFYNMKRGDVQFITSGTGIRHSEKNEHPTDWVHSLQIWVKPWKEGLTPRYDTKSFSDDDKRKGFVTIISPIDKNSTEISAIFPGSLPINAEFTMGSAIILPGKTFDWTVTSDNSDIAKPRNVYVYLPMLKDGKSRIKVADRLDSIIFEGDGAYIEEILPGEKLSIESIGDDEAEVIVLDSA